jgi:predicted ester cyclase
MSKIAEHIAPEYVYHSPFGEYKGPEGFKQFVLTIRNAFPDIQMKIDDMVGEGDTLAVRLSWNGTFKGKFGAFEPTGKKVSMTAAYFYRFKNGKEIEALAYTDTLSFFQQLGVKPPGM